MTKSTARVRNSVIGCAALLSLLAVAVNSTGGQAAPPPASGSASALVAQGKALSAAKKYDQAVAVLSKAAAKLGTAPGSCDCHFCLGKAYCEKAKSEKGTKQIEDYLKAKDELKKARRIGQGNAIAKQANQYLAGNNIPEKYMHPKVGDGTELIAVRLGLSGGQRGLGEVARPKVYEFYADWCDPCKKLKEVIGKAKSTYGDKVEFVSLNVDDKDTQRFLDEYDVSPIPTVIYIDAYDHVVGYTIGFSGDKNVEKELQKLVTQQNAKAPGES
jgi:thiol-disulfide isomerase/thioredoxin